VRTPSEGFLAELNRQNITQLARANVLYDGNVVYAGLAVTNGTVLRDRRRSPRATCDLVVAEPDMIPTPTEGVLSPLGYELQIYCGLELRGTEPYIAYSGLITDDYMVPLTDGSGRYILTPDGGAMFVAGTPESEELLSLGIFPIQRSVINGVTLLTTIRSIDRTGWLLDDELEADTQWPDDIGGSLEAHVERLLRTNPALSDPDVVPTMFAGTSHTPPTVTHAQGTKKWDIIERAASGIGYEAYFDGQGAFRWGPSPSVSGEAVWTFRGGDGGDLIDLDVTLDREPMRNRVIAVGSNAASTTVYRAVATDDNPLSPTRYGGGAGNKQMTIRSSMYTSQEDAQAAADATLEDVAGIARSYDVTQFPNVLLEEGDVVAIEAPRVGVVREIAVLDAITYSLSPEDAGQAQLRTREEVSA
jgi:hypothetical protein